MLFRSLMAFLVAMLTLSCAAGTSEPEPRAPAVPSRTATAEPAPSRAAAGSVMPPSASPAPSSSTSPQASVPAEAEKPVRIARQDLAKRQGIPVDIVQVTKVEPVEWPDTSLGCPEPGKAYAQVITPGYRVLLSAQGSTYEYHTDRDYSVVLCQRR